MNDLRRILALPEGRRVILKILNACGYRTNPFVAADPYATAYKTGQLAVGFWLEQAVKEADLSALTRMEQEYNAEQKQLHCEAEKLEEYL